MYIYKIQHFNLFYRAAVRHENIPCCRREKILKSCLHIVLMRSRIGFLFKYLNSFKFII